MTSYARPLGAGRPKTVNAVYERVHFIILSHLQIKVNTNNLYYYKKNAIWIFTDKNGAEHRKYGGPYRQKCMAE